MVAPPPSALQSTIGYSSGMPVEFGRPFCLGVVMGCREVRVSKHGGGQLEIGVLLKISALQVRAAELRF